MLNSVIRKSTTWHDPRPGLST